MYFFFGVALSCAFFTGPAVSSFGENWWIAVLILSLVTGGGLQLMIFLTDRHSKKLEKDYQKSLPNWMRDPKYREEK